MVQEIQADLNWFVTPNRIEGIWISERKIKEHYQVTPKVWFECEASWDVMMYAWNSDRDFPNTKWTLTLTQSWLTEFSLVDGWIRIPIAWWYLAELTIGWWSSNFQTTVTLKTANTTILTWSFNNGTQTVSTILNFWKFDVLEFWVAWYYSWSSTGASAHGITTIKLKKI